MPRGRRPWSENEQGRDLSTSLSYPDSTAGAAAAQDPHAGHAGMQQSTLAPSGIVTTPADGAVSLTLKVLHFDGYKPLVKKAFL